MWVLIPFIAFIGCWIILCARGFSPRPSLMMACAAWGTAVVVLNESLSVCHAIAFFPFLIGWLLILAGLCYVAYCNKRKLAEHMLLMVASWRRGWGQWPLTDKALIAFLIGIASLKGFSALWSAPNTADAMTYHLSRVEHWIQNNTLAHYPSHILRQLYSPLWAEHAILDLRVLSAGDYFSNAVQWFAAIGSWAGVAGLAQLLGANRRGQLLAALLAATLPMGLVQATSTQTDYVLTFWMVSFVYLLALLYQQPRWPTALAVGASLGLALLSKGSAYIFAPVWMILYVGAALRARQGRQLKLLAAALAIAAVFIIPYAMRNITAFGKPNWSEVPLTNERMTLPSVAANILGSAALHLGTPWEKMNQSIAQGLDGLAQGLGFDLQYPDINPGGEEFHFKKMSTGEDDAGNGLYLLLFLSLLLLMAVLAPLRRKIYWLYAGGVIVSFVLFCVIVRYHEFNARYHLAIFVLSCALSGTVLASLCRRWVILPAALLLMASLTWLLACNEHAFLGPRNIFVTTRHQQYFSERPYLRLPYSVIVQGIQSYNCREVGVIQGEDNYEYPWWVLLREAYGDKFRLEQVEVNNISNKLPYPKGPFVPCALIASNDKREAIILPQGIYLRRWYMDMPQGMTAVYTKEF